MNRRISALSHIKGALQALLIIQGYSAGIAQFLSNNDNENIKYSLYENTKYSSYKNMKYLSYENTKNSSYPSSIISISLPQ